MRAPGILFNLERNIRDDYRNVRSKGVRERRGEKEYTWTFDTSLSIKRRSLKAEAAGKDRRYVSHLSPEEQLAAKSPEEQGAGKDDKPAAKSSQKRPPKERETLADAGATDAVRRVQKASQ